MSADLDGAVAIVTGAGRGIGAAVSVHLAKAGALMVMADVRPVAEWSQAAQVVAREAAREPFAIEVDVRSEESCRDLVTASRLRFGRLDVLINNAAVNLFLDADSTTPEQFNAIIDVNLTGSFRMARAAHASLASGGRGAVVNVASACGQVATAGSAAYCVSKAGVMHLTRILAVEWAPAVRVNGVAPTVVATEMSRPAREDLEYMADKLAAIPLARIATVDEVAAAITFLASSSAAMVTGQTIFVDGGLSVR